MKSLLLLVALIALAGCTFKKPTKSELLIGKWRDENSVIEYRTDGSKIAVYDSGWRMNGQWTIQDGNILATLIQGGNRMPQNDHKILSITKSEMVLENMASHQVFHAKRVK